MVNDWPVVLFLMLIFHVVPDSLVTLAVNESPGCTVMPGMTVSGAGRISHQARYDARPLLKSASVPVWIRFELLNPSMPTPSDENRLGVFDVRDTVGTVQLPTAVVNVPVSA